MQLLSTKPPARGWFNVGTTSLAHFTGDYYSNILPVLLPILALQFGLSYSQCGMLYMCFQVAASILQAPIGIAADKRNLGIIFPLSILLCGVLASFIGLCSTPTALVIVICIAGISASGFHPIAGGILPTVAPKGKEVLATSIFIVGGNIGFAVSPFITAIYLEYFTPAEISYLAVFPVLVTLLIMQRRLYIRKIEKTDKAVISLKIILSNRPFLWLVGSIGCRAIGYCALVLYIPLLFAEKGVSAVSASSILMTMLIGTAVGGLVVGGASTFLRIKTIILLSYLLTLVMLVVFLKCADDSILSYISVFFAGFGLYGSTPPAIVWAQKLLPHADSFATSMMLGFTFGIGYIMCVFIGMVGDLLGLHTALWCFLPASLILASLLILKVADRKE